MRTPYTDWIALHLICAVGVGCRGCVVPHHIRGKGAHGQIDEGNVAPLCWTHHEEGHRIGWRTWSRRYKVCLPAVGLLAFLKYQHGTPDFSSDMDF